MTRSDVVKETLWGRAAEKTDMILKQLRSVCVRVYVCFRDRQSVCAWASQAIVPENLTQTQDILKTFMQQWPDKQHAVIRNKAQVGVGKIITMLVSIKTLPSSCLHLMNMHERVLFIGTCHLSFKRCRAIFQLRGQRCMHHKAEHIMLYHVAPDRQADMWSREGPIKVNYDC